MPPLKSRRRKKLAKQLGKLVKRHGAEIALSLVTGIIAGIAAEAAGKAARKRKGPAGPVVVRRRDSLRGSRR